MVVFWAIFYLPHDLNLWRLGRHYARLVHPAGTRVVRRWSEVGNLIANGNHIDYFVGEMRSYTGSRQAIRHFYNGKTIWFPAARRRWGVDFLFVDELKINEMTDLSVPHPVVETATHLGRHQAMRHHLYIVYVFDSGYDWGWDIRGQ
jgi:hypothetical protein